MPDATNEVPQIRLIRAALRQSGSVQISVRGSSMLPVLQPGAIVTIASRPFSSVQRGQVVAITCGQRLIVHRVIDRTLEYLVTLGDNMRLLDPPATPEMYVGVIADIRNAVPPLQVGGRISAIRATQLDWKPPISPVSTVKIVLPEGTEAVVPPGITLAVLPPGFAVSSQDSLCIGISGAGALTRHALPELLDMGVRCHLPLLILLGFTFGPSNPASDEPVLPPEIAAFHVRLGRPWQDFELGAALDELRAQLDFCRCRTTVACWLGDAPTLSRTGDLQWMSPVQSATELPLPAQICPWKPAGRPGSRS